ncbi:MAG: DUF350 domain-containing protein [Sphingomonas sp.]|jgi:putative membrane protein|uniref:DUF350 domain-containing protein n=1 Tax=Sphingomonas sp. TaxID=28214 RepID=UPI000A0B9F75|nr:DUF350 domain-containing protein [Sphingomonas sp.]MBX9880534.1 DUF350 domain-containing protein [Sphingomonas sp.]OQW44159.1 MAG: hypothetical protein A4S16_04080 [Proteobacteria bacterium SG_bin6]
MINWAGLIGTLVYAVVGIVVFAVGFFVFDALTPGKLWEEIHQKQNLAVATFAGFVALGFALIVAAAVHG